MSVIIHLHFTYFIHLFIHMHIYLSTTSHILLCISWCVHIFICVIYIHFFISYFLSLILILFHPFPLFLIFLSFSFFFLSWSLSLLFSLSQCPPFKQYPTNGWRPIISPNEQELHSRRADPRSQSRWPTFFFKIFRLETHVV